MCSEGGRSWSVIKMLTFEDQMSHLESSQTESQYSSQTVHGDIGFGTMTTYPSNYKTAIVVLSQHQHFPSAYVTNSPVHQLVTREERNSSYCTSVFSSASAAIPRKNTPYTTNNPSHSSTSLPCCSYPCASPPILSILRHCLHHHTLGHRLLRRCRRPSSS